VIGGNIDLDLLSLFPQKDSRSMGGMEEDGQAFEVNKWRREKSKSWMVQGGRRGIYRWVEIWPLEEARMGFRP
jgi:hypothetical protein